MHGGDQRSNKTKGQGSNCNQPRASSTPFATVCAPVGVHQRMSATKKREHLDSIRINKRHTPPLIKPSLYLNPRKGSGCTLACGLLCPGEGVIWASGSKGWMRMSATTHGMSNALGIGIKRERLECSCSVSSLAPIGTLQILPATREERPIATECQPHANPMPTSCHLIASHANLIAIACQPHRIRL